jgi:hypothetical protein
MCLRSHVLYCTYITYMHTYIHTYIHIYTDTTQVTHESIVQCFKAGANDFITKPFHNEELKEKLNVHLKIRNGIRSRAVVSTPAGSSKGANQDGGDATKAGGAGPGETVAGSVSRSDSGGSGSALTHVQHAPGSLVACIVLYVHVAALEGEAPPPSTNASKVSTYVVGNARMISAMAAKSSSKDALAATTIATLASRLSELSRTYSLQWTSLGDAFVAYSELRSTTVAAASYECVMSAALALADSVLMQNITADVRMSVQRGTLRCADTPHGRTLFGQAYTSARKMVDKSAHLSIVVSQRVHDEMPAKYQWLDSTVVDECDSVGRIWVLKDRRLAWEQCGNEMQAAAKSRGAGAGGGATAKSAAAQGSIKKVLEMVGLAHLTDNFEREEITPDLIPDCNDDMLKELGVTSMGARMRLRKTVAL